MTGDFTDDILENWGLFNAKDRQERKSEMEMDLSIAAIRGNYITVRYGPIRTARFACQVDRMYCPKSSLFGPSSDGYCFLQDNHTFYD